MRRPTVAIPGPHTSKALRLGAKLLQSIDPRISHPDAVMGLAAAIGLIHGTPGSPPLDRDMLESLNEIMLGAADFSTRPNGEKPH